MGGELAFLNKIQALHCEGFHCKGSSAFIGSQSRCAARWGKVLGQADHGVPVQESFAYIHPCKLGKMWKIWPGIVHGQCHQASLPHSLSPQLSYAESRSGRWAGGPSLVWSKEQSILRQKGWIWCTAPLLTWLNLRGREKAVPIDRLLLHPLTNILTSVLGCT